MKGPLLFGLVLAIWVMGFGYLFCGVILYSLVGWWMIPLGWAGSVAFGWFALPRLYP